MTAKFLIFAAPIILLVGLYNWQKFFWGRRPSLYPPPGPSPRPNVTAEDVEYFQHHGWTVIRNVASPEWVAYLRDTVDDRMNHPHSFSQISRAAGVFKYHQINAWMATEGIFNWYRYNGDAIHAAVEPFTGYKSLRLVHESIDLYPTFTMGDRNVRHLPMHVDCIPHGRCSDNLQMRMYLTLDYVPSGGAVNFVKNDRFENDDVAGTAMSHWESRLVIVPELYPGDVLIWDMHLHHTAFVSERRVISWTAVDAEEIMEPGVGIAWLGMFDFDVFKNQRSPYYPIIYPKMSQNDIEAHKRFTGIPTFWNALTYLRKVMPVSRSSSATFFYPEKDQQSIQQEPDGKCTNEGSCKPKMQGAATKPGFQLMVAALKTVDRALTWMNL